MPLTSDLTKFTTQAPLQVNLNFSDVASGTGYIEFSGWTESTSTGDDFFMSTNPIYSSDGTVAVAASGDIDVDTPEFTKPLTIEGDAFVEISYGGANMASSDNVIPTVTLYRYDGSTETSLGAITFPTKVGVDPGTNVDRSASGKIAISRQTLQKGDLIRATVSNSGNNSMVLYMSPYDLETEYTDAVHTKFLIKLPIPL